ncbi:MAG: biotin/lipoyl-containing protein, partial [Pseudomonadota bacterium]
SPLLDEATRKKMGEQSVALAAAVDYDSAGTVEFVVGQDKSFYFLEMNTRLQVEHPVTELITGVDLVEQMIRSAAGEKLAIKQKDIKLKGWAVESRIYAEDPFRNFLPSIGRLTRYEPPAEQSGPDDTVRNDTGVSDGGEISMFYDPMIAKLVTHAETRSAAIELQSNALDAFYLDGIQHNIPFLAALMQHPRWQSGELTTGFIAEEFPDGFVPKSASETDIRVLAAVAAAIDFLSNRRRREISDQMSGPSVRFALDRVVQLGDVAKSVRVSGGELSETEVAFLDADGAVVDTAQLRSDWWPGQAIWHGEVDGKPVAVQVRSILNGHKLSFRGVQIESHVFTRREAELAALMPVKEAPDLSKFLLCPMPGLVKAIHVGVGDKVFAGDTLAVVEAMKMENVLRA